VAEVPFPTACRKNVASDEWGPARTDKAGSNHQRKEARPSSDARANRRARTALDEWGEDPAEQPMRRDRLVHIEEVEAEQHKDDVDDDNPVKGRHGCPNDGEGLSLAEGTLAKKPGLKKQPGLSN
jgi:hypothetical protein